MCVMRSAADHTQVKIAVARRLPGRARGEWMILRTMGQRREGYLDKRVLQKLPRTRTAAACARWRKGLAQVPDVGWMVTQAFQTACPGSAADKCVTETFRNASGPPSCGVVGDTKCCQYSMQP